MFRAKYIILFLFVFLFLSYSYSQRYSEYLKFTGFFKPLVTPLTFHEGSEFPEKGNGTLLDTNYIIKFMLLNAYMNKTDPFFALEDYKCSGLGKISYNNLTGILYNTITTPTGAGNPLLILKLFKNGLRTDELVLMDYHEDLPYSESNSECIIGDSLRFTKTTSYHTNGFYKDAIVVHDIHKTIELYAADSNGKIRLVNKYDSFFLINKFARTNSLFPAVIDKGFEYQESVKVHTAHKYKKFGIDTNGLVTYGYDDIFYNPFGDYAETKKSLAEVKQLRTYDLDTTIISLGLPVVIRGEVICYGNSKIIFDKQTEEVIYADIRDPFKIELLGINVGMDVKNFYDKIFGFYNATFTKFRQVKFDTGLLDNSLNFFITKDRLVRVEYKNFSY